MTIDYNKTAEDLTAGLSRLQTEFEKLQSGQTKSQLEAQGDLSNKTSTALDRLLDLTKILDGDFNAAPPPSTVAAALTDLDSSWQAAEKAAENCLTLMNSYSVLVVQFHDAELGGWQENTTKMDAAVNAELNSTKEALQHQQDALQVARNAQAVAQGSLSDLRQKLNRQRHKYDEADMVKFINPAAWLILEALKPVIEALTNSVADAEKAAHIAEQTAAAADKAVADASIQTNNLATMAQKQAVLLEQGKQLMSECSLLVGAVEAAQTEVAHIKTQRYNAWQIVALCLNHAENAQFGLTKADYGTAVLQVAELALKDETTKPQVASIVNHLAQHDDTNGSIKNAKTDDHPEGILVYLQGQLSGSLNGVLAEPRFMASGLNFGLLRSVGAGSAAGLSPENKGSLESFVTNLMVY